MGSLRVARMQSPLLLALAVVCSFASADTTYFNMESVELLTLGEGPWYRRFESGQLYNFSVNATGSYSAHIFQVHAAEHISLTLTNTSSTCNSSLECRTIGTHVGMVQLHSYSSRSTVYSVKHSCVRENCSVSQLVLVAVVGIPLNHPIPGGCSLTSALEIEASLSEAKVNGSFTVTFQDSDIGYDPYVTLPRMSPPPCTDSFMFVTRLDYMVYQKCVPSPTLNSTFKTIEGMLSAEGIYEDIWHFPFKTLSYSDVKKVAYYATQQPGMVLNVVARDTKTGTTSAYIPTVSFTCDYSTGQCDSSLPAATLVYAVLIGFAGLCLCVLTHRFFHVEVFLFTLLISVYIIYMILLSVTDWDGVDLAVGVAGCGLILTILLFVLWFLTNALFVFLTLFGVAMGFVITAAILYTPLGSYELVRVPYIYILILLSGLFLWMLPFVFFSSVLNIVSSAVVGSYAFTFGIGLLVHSSFTDIILRVARNAAIPGYLSVNSFCVMTNTDALLLLVWIVVCALSITIQATIELFRRRSFKIQQARIRKYTRTDSDLVDPARRRYSAFPSASLFKQLRRCLSPRRTRSNVQFPPSSDDSGNTHTRSGENRPLLSPSRLPNQRYT